MTKNQAFTILSAAGGTRAARIITDNTKNFSRIKIWRMARALRRGVPVAKIIHIKWFYGLKFYTNRHTLDPRPDTETLVSAVISDCDETRHAPRILDIGTGTGCIICALVKNITNATGIGVDISCTARAVARRNVRAHNLNNKIKIMRGDMTRADMTRRQFDIIVSNPPYIAHGDARVDRGAMHDPHRALYADDNGYDLYHALAKNAGLWLMPHGKIYIEIGDGMHTRVQEIFEKNGWTFVHSERDLGDITRVMIFSHD